MTGVLYVDADACPVKHEVLAVAERHGWRVVLVGNSWMRGLDHPLVSQVVAAPGPDQADDRIVERITVGDIVVTADIPLAARCVAKGGLGIDHRGKRFDANSIGMALAVRDLLTGLRDSGTLDGGGPKPFAKADRARFKDGLDRLLLSVRSKSD